jgi:RNA polymerase sigma-70 factor, ECF subfamily
MLSMGDEPRTVTMLLRDWRGGDRAALDALMPVIYAELHKLAASHVRRERPDHPLRPTDLVGEAYVRLAEGQAPHLDDRVHFFGIAARIMRQILVDHARKHNAEKRGSGDKPVTFDELKVCAERSDDIVALDQALEALAQVDERKARVIELRYFAGLTQDEIATALGVHVNTVARDIRIGEAWLRRFLCGEPVA